MAEGKYASANIVPSTDTFREWMDLTNRITYDMEKIVVTTGQVTQPNSTDKVGYVQGNTYIEGHAQVSNVAIVTNLRGGTVDTPAVLNISSNVVIGDAVADLCTVTATIHSTGIMPRANAYPLGNATSRWDLTGEDVNLSNTILIGAVTSNTTTNGVFGNSTYLSVSNNTTNVEATYAKVAVSNSTTNTTVSKVGVNIGNTTVNVFANSTYGGFVNSTTNTAITRSGVNIGNTTVNSQSNSIATLIANSTVTNLIKNGSIHITGATNSMNLQSNAVSVRVGNTTVNTQISPTAVVTDGTLDVLGATTLRNTLDVTGIATFNANVDLQDDDVLKIGTGDDLLIYHDGNHSYITDNDVGSLKITASQLDILGSGETMATFIDNGAVTLYFDDGAKLATKTDGVDITGELQSDSLDVDGVSQLDGTVTVGVNGTGYDVIMYGDTAGQKLTWDQSADKLIVNGTANVSGTLGVVGAATLSNTIAVTGAATLSNTLGVTGVGTFGNDVDITGEVNAATAAIVGAATVGGTLGVTGAATLSSTLGVTGVVTLAEDIDQASSKQANVAALRVRSTSALEGAVTASADVALNANTNIPDDKYLRIGTGADLLLYHDQSHSYVEDSGTGNLKLKGTQVDIVGTGETMATFVDDGAVTLNFNDAAKLATKVDGVDITGELQSDSLDVDGVSNFAGALSVGVNDAGHDVIFYGDTSAKNATWDASSDKFYVTGTARVTDGLQLDGITTTSANISSTGDLFLGNNASETFLLKVNKLEVTNTYSLPAGGSPSYDSVTSQDLTINGNTVLGDAAADHIWPKATFGNSAGGITGVTVAPVANSVLLGNTTNRWAGAFITANVSGLAAFGANTTFDDNIVVDHNMTANNVYALNDIVANYSSDQRLKDNVSVITEPIDKLKAIKGVRFNWNSGIEDNRVGKPEFGVIAQDIESVMPESVATNHAGYMSVNYNHLIALLIEAVKALETRVETLENS